MLESFANACAVGNDCTLVLVREDKCSRGRSHPRDGTSGKTLFERPFGPQPSDPLLAQACRYNKRMRESGHNKRMREYLIVRVVYLRVKGGDFSRSVEPDHSTCHLNSPRMRS